VALPGWPSVWGQIDSGSCVGKIGNARHRSRKVKKVKNEKCKKSLSKKSL
jgi:hypothetical protein